MRSQCTLNKGTVVSLQKIQWTMGHWKSRMETSSPGYRRDTMWPASAADPPPTHLIPVKKRNSKVLTEIYFYTDEPLWLRGTIPNEVLCSHQGKLWFECCSADWLRGKFQEQLIAWAASHALASMPQGQGLFTQLRTAIIAIKTQQFLIFSFKHSLW